MSYFDDASLVMIPSGYKDQKVYSVKPLDGSGDLTFSRASSATRVASNGLIEKVRTNLILQSEDFTTSWFPNIAPTITANTTVAPNGTTTADTIASSGTGSGVFQVPTVVNGVEYSFSIYVKNISSATNIRIGCDLAPANGLLNFNAVTGAIISTGAGITGSSVTNVGNGWYRVSGTYITTGTTNTFVVFGESAMSFAVWGAQLETGVTTAYIATTSAAVSVGPVSGLPRLDYLNSTCPRLLLEPQRTNLAIYSEQLTNAEYTADNASFTANAAASPDGYTNADLLTENSSSAAHGFYASVATRGTTGASLTTSIFAKSNGRRYINISGGFDSGNYYNAVFDLQNGVVSTTGNSGAGTSPVASIVSYGNGWYRCIVTGSVTGLNNRLSFVYLSNSTTGNGVSGATYTGNGTSGAYFYGYQIEAGAYATSYIPTLGTSVTRVADAASKTGISSLIGQTEGTLFVEFSAQDSTGSGQAIATIYQNSSNVIILYKQNDNILKCFVVTAGTLVADLGSVTVSGNVKMAIAYKSNDFALYINGTQRGVDTAGAVPACSNLYLGADDGGAQKMTGKVSQALLFTTRLTNAQLAELTTL